MAYFEGYETSGGTAGRIALGSNSIRYSDIISGNFAFKGSTFTIQEIAKFQFAIINDSLVDADLRHATTRRYIGAYEIGVRTDEIIPGTDKNKYISTGTDDKEYSGYFTNETAQISRYTTVTIGDTTAKERVHSEVVLDACNFATVNGTLDIPPVTISASVLQNNFNVFNGRISEAPTKLDLSQKFYGKLAAIGLFINPGIIFIGAQKEVSVVNILSSINTVAQGYTCSTGGGCEQEFKLFVLDNNNGKSIDTAGGRFFSTYAGAAAETGTPPDTNVYTCTSDGTTRTYYTTTVS